MPRKKRTDLSCYPVIIKLVKDLYGDLSPEDQHDLAHEVCIKLITSPIQQANASLLCTMIRQIAANSARDNRRVVYNSDLLDKLTGERS